MRVTGLLVMASAVIAATAAGTLFARTMSRNLDPTVIGRADAYLSAVLKGDAAAVASLYRDDAIEMLPARPAVEGKAAIEGCYREMFAGPVKVTGFTFSHVESTIAGDVAYDIGTYKRTMTVPGAPGPIVDNGKYVVILKRTAGDWKAAYVINNSDRETR
jgi:uncharacterized protein (TIGR02246 family)